jgi:hypothetical protein
MRLWVAISAAFAVSAATPQAAAKGSLMQGFATGAVAATIATDRCIGMQEDVAYQASLWARMEDDGYKGADLRARIAEARPKVEAAFAKTGAAEWCAAAWQLFGPSGLRFIKAK